MASHLSEFYYSPHVARLNYKFGFFIAHKLNESEASSGIDFDRAYQFRVNEYYRDGRISFKDVVPLDQGEDFKTILLEFESKVVATVTLHFLEDLSTIEIKNLVVHREFRGTDVINRIFEIIHRELVRARRKTLITSCVKELAGKYQEIAFKKTGEECIRSYGRPDKLYVMRSTQYRFGAYGLHVGPLKWGSFLSKVYIELKEEYPHGPLQKLVLGFYAFLGPISLSLYYCSVYIRWLQWQYKRTSSQRVSLIRFLMMLVLR